ncbi:MAG: prepilin-type N-terminal cleavage/methylation domain-containing protein [Phycisphaerae bacterium]|nr:prepilin-type N-terminal cleavage/methylation domain-containing protein [Phycisphaerae bacterium]
MKRIANNQIGSCRRIATYRAAFTLVELLTVLLIIALLLGIATPSIMSIRTSILVGQSRVTIGLIEGACEQYRNDFGDYPPSDDPDNYLGWYGCQLLPLFLIGYGPDAGGDGDPYGEDNDKNLAEDDGRDGFGFRTTKRGMVYGPYNGTEKLQMKESYYPIAGGGPHNLNDSTAGRQPAFVDAFDNVIAYFSRDDEGNFHGAYWQYDKLDREPLVCMRVQGIFTHESHGFLTSYFKDIDGVPIGNDILIASPGADRRFEAVFDNPQTDDITNFFEE